MGVLYMTNQAMPKSGANQNDSCLHSVDDLEPGLRDGDAVVVRVGRERALSWADFALLLLILLLLLVGQVPGDLCFIGVDISYLNILGTDQQLNKTRLRLDACREEVKHGDLTK